MNKKLSGDLTDQEYLKEVIRVNHAGEYGAIRIYQGQYAFLKNSSDKDLIKEMRNQEQKHLEFFEQQIKMNQVRPTALLPIWHVLGYALGATTALFGKNAAMVCTEAVEEVIDEHYLSQIKQLPDNKQELKDKIEQFRQEELEHKEIAHNHSSDLNLFHKILGKGIKIGCKIAINLSKKI